MDPHTFMDGVGRTKRNGCQVPDPGDTGTFDLVPQRAYQFCVVKSSGAEARVLKSAAQFPVGARFDVYVDTVGSSVGITQASGDELTSAQDTVVTANDDGDSVRFMVSQDTGVKQWRMLMSDGIA